jgi:hypothetical protein
VSLISSIAASAFRKPKSAFIETLQPNSRYLIEISEDFRPIATKYAIISFVEEDVYTEIGTVVRLLAP